MHLQSELLTHIQNTRSQYNLPAFEKRIRPSSNRAEVADHFPQAMHQNDAPARPASLAAIGGPVDPFAAPTRISMLLAATPRLIRSDSSKLARSLAVGYSDLCSLSTTRRRSSARTAR